MSESSPTVPQSVFFGTPESCGARELTMSELLMAGCERLGAEAQINASVSEIVDLTKVVTGWCLALWSGNLCLHQE